MSSLQDKLYNQFQIPPEKVWKKIAAALDDSYIANEFPSTLYQAEVIPSATTWEQIASSLDNDTPTLISAPKKKFRIIRYAAAAIIIGIISFGVIKWTGISAKNSDKHDTAIAQNNDASSNKKINSLSEDIAVSIDRNYDSTISRENENSIAQANAIETNTPKKARKKYTIPDENVLETEPIYASNEFTSTDLADRYVMLMTPNGIVRMSKKLSSLVCCVSGEEQDEDCKDQLKKWQEKIACSPIAPSPGNFIDILSLVNTLNNKEL